MGLLDYSKANPWVSDALATISQGLLSYGSGNQNAMAQLPQYLAERQGARRNEQRQAKIDQRQEQIWQREEEERQRTMNQEAAKAQAFQGLLPTLPENIRGTAQAMGPSFVDIWGKEQVQNQFDSPDNTAPTIKDFYEGGNVAQKQWNSQTKAWETIGQGPRWAPNNETGNSPEYGLAPFYTVDDKGVTHGWQLSKSGGLQEIPVPEGQKIAPQTQVLDTGTGFVGIDKRSPGEVSPIAPKDVAGVQAEQAVGEATGAAKVSLPEVTAKADTALALIDDLLTDPNRELATGMSSFLGKVPGTPAYDYAQKVEQLKGQTFLTAFQSLKGGGAITEVEGRKAEQAIARLDAAQTEGGFTSALNELKGIVVAAKQRAIQKAQGGGTSSGSTLTYNPATGEFE